MTASAASTGDAAGPPAGSGVVRSSVPVALGTALSRITGLARLAALAYALGFTRLTDTYNLANTTPNIVYELLLGGVLSATLVPVFVDQRARAGRDGPDQDGPGRDGTADEGTSAVVSVALIALVALTVVGVLAAPAIVRLYTLRVEGAAAADQRAVATTLLRLFMPQMFFYGTTALATALLHSRRRFAAPAFAPVLTNLVVTASFLALPHLAGTGDILSGGGGLTLAGVRHDPGLALVLGLGTTIGIAAMAIALLPAVARAGVRLRFRPDWRHPAVRRVMVLSGWTAGYVASNQVALWVVLLLANDTAGGVSAYQAAFVFFQLPHGLIAVSVMTALVPDLAASVSGGDLAGFRRQMALGVRLMALVILPASAGYFVLARPVVEVLLDRGALTGGASDLTGGVLTAFALGLYPFSVYLLALRGFYASGDTRTPFLLNLMENGLNIGLAFVFVPFLGVEGLALAYALAYSVAAPVAVVALGRKAGGRIVDVELAGRLARIALGAAVMAPVVHLTVKALPGSLPLAVSLAVAVIVGAAVYGAALAAQGVLGDLRAVGANRRRS